MQWENCKMNCTSITAIFKWNAVLLCVVNVICTIAGTILNSVVILSLWNSQLRKKLCYFMIFILACFDLAVVVVIHPLIIIEIISCWMPADFIEYWVQYVICILFNFSLSALLAMTVERYLALVYPFFHTKIVTKSKLVTAFVLFQLPFEISCIIQKDKRVISYAVDGVVILVICILNFKLFCVARTLRKSAVITLGSLSGSASELRNNFDSRKFKLTFSNLRKISTCLLAIACLIICYLPWIVYLGLNISQALIMDQHSFIIEHWFETLCALNSSLNCLIFFYKNSVLRRHGKNFLEIVFLQKNYFP